jgi:hypothetical protein
MHGLPLVPGVNVDPVDISAGMAEAGACGFDGAADLIVIEYALRRWLRGEEEGAEATIRHNLIDYTAWRRILAAAVMAGKDKS